jgi:hypothetical protein
MPNVYELNRLSDCFERLALLSNEVSCLSIKTDIGRLTNDELQTAVIYLQLAAELREIVLRYAPDLQPINTPGLTDRWVRAAWAALEGGN